MMIARAVRLAGRPGGSGQFDRILPRQGAGEGLGAGQLDFQRPERRLFNDFGPGEVGIEAAQARDAPARGSDRHAAFAGQVVDVGQDRRRVGLRMSLDEGDVVTQVRSVSAHRVFGRRASRLQALQVGFGQLHCNDHARLP